MIQPAEQNFLENAHARVNCANIPPAKEHLLVFSAIPDDHPVHDIEINFQAADRLLQRELGANPTMLGRMAVELFPKSKETPDASERRMGLLPVLSHLNGSSFTVDDGCAYYPVISLQVDLAGYEKQPKRSVNRLNRDFLHQLAHVTQENPLPFYADAGKVRLARVVLGVATLSSQTALAMDIADYNTILGATHLTIGILGLTGMMSVRHASYYYSGREREAREFARQHKDTALVTLRSGGDLI